MIRTILASLAVAAMLSMAAADRAASQDFQIWQRGFGNSLSGESGKPATKASRQLKSNQRAVRCDCSNCSAHHCHDWFVSDSFGFGVEREMKEPKEAGRKLRRK